jgi:hypothetical protein
VSADDLLHRLLAGFVQSLAPLDDAVSSPEGLAAFLRQFGWSLEPSDSAHVQASLNGISLPADPTSMSTGELLAQIASITSAIRSIATSGAPSTFATTFPGELLDFLIYSALANQMPRIFALLHFGGVLSEQSLPADPATGRGEYVARTLHWDRLSLLEDQPVEAVKQAYGWGSDFDGDGLLRSLGLLIQVFGGQAGLYAADRGLVDQYYAPGAAQAAGIRNLIVTVPFLSASLFGDGLSASTRIALLALPIPPSTNAPDRADGLVLLPLVTGQASDSLSLSDEASLKLSGDFLSRPIRAEIHPASTVVRATAGDTHVDASARLDAKAQAGTPWLAFGDATSSRLEVSAVHASLGMSGQVDSDLNLQVEVGIDAAALVIDLSESDSFLQDSVSSGPARSPLSLVAKWSSHSGFALVGQPRLAVVLPVDQSIGGLARIESVGLALGGAPGNAVNLDATLTFVAFIGPVEVTITEAGVRAQLKPVGDADPPGNLGDVDLQFGFKPPSGAGVKLDAAVVTGGGYLAHDDQKAEYAGALDLSLSGVTVKAFGLVQTRLPGGSGYSFLVVLSAEFTPPLELPFGFSLEGVGGLLGLNRSIDETAVQAAIWAHKLDGLLFPADPIASAPQLISALDSYFPAAPGRFLVGPLAKIGWGEGIADGRVALLVELPEPLKLLLIGDVDVSVPSAEPVLVLHISFDGGVDVRKQLAFFDASLHDSKIDTFPLTGGLAFRYAWSDPGVFALAVGGFNPHYQPPDNFPALKRLAIAIGSSVAQITAQGYLAVTSNTLQFGAHLELTAGAGGFNVHGFLGFDALCEWSPFSFEFDLSAGVDLRAGTDVLASVHLSGQFSGPTPWHIQGQASFSLLFFDISVHFDKTWGSTAPALPLPDPAALVRAAFSNRASWSGVLPATAHAIVGVAGTPSDAGGAVLLDPAAALQISQRVAPLYQPISRFAGTPLGQTLQFTVDNLTVFNAAIADPDRTSDEFAPGQYLDLSDADKLSLPSFSRFPSGVQAGQHTYDLGSSSRPRTIPSPLTYDTTILDSQPAPPGPAYTLSHATLLAMNGSSQPTQPGLGRYAPAPGGAPLVTLATEQWAIATVSTLQPQADLPTTGSKLAARQALHDYLAEHPDQAGQLQTVLTTETT